MKFIGFFGKGKDAAEPVLEYHPPCEGQPEEEEPVMIHRRQPMAWNGTEEPEESDELQEEMEQFSEDEPGLPAKPRESRRGKRRMVTAALVMALGAAVYLNWQFSGNQELLASDTLNSEKEMGTAQLVNGDAEETDASAAEEEESVFTQAKLSRQKARDEAVEMLEEVLKDSESSAEAKKKAVAQSAVIAQNVLKENNIENLVKAKGYSDCVAVIQDDECSVIVGGKLENSSDAVVIQDIVVSQTSFAPEKIKIIEGK